MSKLTVWVGVVLVVLGVVGYVATDMVSPTALIPAAFGVALALLGWLGRDDARRKTTMHASMGIALLGILGSASGLLSVPALLTGGDVARPAAVMSRSAMALVLLGYLVVGVRSFVQARRNRAA